MIKLKFSIAILILVLSSCSDSKYVMPNMLNVDYIDVTEYVDQGYIPVEGYRKDGVLSELIKPDVPPVDEKYYKEIEKEIFNEYKQQVVIRSNDIIYKHSYIITYDLVDVYEIIIMINNQKKRIYFTIHQNKILLPLGYDEERAD